MDKHLHLADTIRGDCPHCNTKHVAFTRISEIAWKEHPEEVYPHKDIAAKCSYCGRGVIIPFSRGRTKYGEAFLSEGTCFPAPSKTIAPEHTPVNISNFFIQGLENLPRNFDAAGSMFRKALEVGLKYKFPQKTGTLYDRIESAKKAQLLTPEMADWAHKIRKLGNDAVHDEEPWTKQEAQEIKDFTELVFQYLFTLPGMMKRAKPEEKQENQ